MEIGKSNSTDFPTSDTCGIEQTRQKFYHECEHSTFRHDEQSVQYLHFGWMKCTFTLYTQKVFVLFVYMAFVYAYVACFIHPLRNISNLWYFPHWKWNFLLWISLYAVFLLLRLLLYGRFVWCIANFFGNHSISWMNMYEFSVLSIGKEWLSSHSNNHTIKIWRQFAVDLACCFAFNLMDISSYVLHSHSDFIDARSPFFLVFLCVSIPHCLASTFISPSIVYFHAFAP